MEILQIHKHHGLAWLGVALLIVDVGQFLELLLDPVRDLLHCFQRGGPGPYRLRNHGLDGEGRILLAAETAILENTGERDNQHEIDDEALVF